MSSWDEYHGLMQAITSLWRICWYLQKECSGRGELTDKHKSSKNITAGKTLTFWPSFMEQLEGKPGVQFSAAAYPSSHTFIRSVSILQSSGSITWRFSQAAPHSCDHITTGWQSNKKHILIIFKNLSWGLNTWRWISSGCTLFLSVEHSLITPSASLCFQLPAPIIGKEAGRWIVWVVQHPPFHTTQELFLGCFL